MNELNITYVMELHGFPILNLSLRILE